MNKFSCLCALLDDHLGLRVDEVADVLEDEVAGSVDHDLGLDRHHGVACRDPPPVAAPDDRRVASNGVTSILFLLLLVTLIPVAPDVLLRPLALPLARPRPSAAPITLMSG